MAIPMHFKQEFLLYMGVYWVRFSYKYILVVLSALVLLAGCGVVASNPQAAAPDPNSSSDSSAPFSSRVASTAGVKPELPAITVPAGTPIGIRLQNSISS